MPATATRRLLTATEAQIKSGRSMVRFRQWVADGQLPFTLDELGRRRFAADDVDRRVAQADRYRRWDDAVTPVPATEARAGGVTYDDLLRMIARSSQGGTQ